jgi:hypothetical protein
MANLMANLDLSIGLRKRRRKREKAKHARGDPIGLTSLRGTALANKVSLPVRVFCFQVLQRLLSKDPSGSYYFCCIY